jgi:succinate dehydrogenase/fumarate reductase-like Fe-S protein
MIPTEDSMEQRPVRVKISRYSPEDKRQRIDTFEVPHAPGMTVQALLRHLYEDLDPTLAFRDFRCGRGVCNTCLIKVNGKVRRSCETLVPRGQELLLEPPNSRIIKDLVVQFD